MEGPLRCKDAANRRLGEIPTIAISYAEKFIFDPRFATEHMMHAFFGGISAYVIRPTNRALSFCWANAAWLRQRDALPTACLQDHHSE